MRLLDELIDEEDSAAPMLEEFSARIPGRCEALPPSAERGNVLLRTQVTTRSPMGAVVYHTGGIVIDDWLRVLGSGSPRITRNLPDWNEGRSNGCYLVADDVAGGFFAIDGGGLGFGDGQICYWAPDSMDWLCLECGYTQFLAWAMTGDTDGFFKDLRWPNWRQDVADIPGDRCMSFYPFLWTAEGSISSSCRAVVPVQEAFDMKTDICRQLAVQ